MTMQFRRHAVVSLAVLGVLVLCVSLSPVPVSAQGATISVFATGLENPRGLRFGPDGNLYVAEGGLGGTMTTTPGDCEQVIPPVGPYSGGYTGRISRIDSTGARTDFATGLPSSQTSPLLGSLVSGVADVDFIDGTMYALLAGAGCSHGLANTVNAILRLDNQGSWQLVADLSSYQMANPVAQPEEEDFEPDGTWYSMVSVRGSLYAVEPNHGEVVRVTPDGTISRVVDVSASQGHIVPTAIAYHGNFFFGNLSTFPIMEGAAKVMKLTPSGNLQTWQTGLTNVVGLAFDNRDRMYVLENTVGNGILPTPGLGRIERVDPSGRRTVIASGLELPTAMTFGPDGNLYVSNWGFGPPAPMGTILKVTLPKN